jgi:transcription antitermination factor NusG
MEKFFVQNLPWNALYVIYKSEKKVCEYLNELGIETFLPLYTKVRLWRNKKIKSKIPLFSCYVFAKVPRTLRYQALNVVGTVKFVTTRGNIPSIIPEKEIDIIKRLTGIKPDMNIKKENYFEVGQHVRVNHEPLKGLEGILSEKRGRNRFFVKIHSIQQALSLEIDGDLLEPVKFVNDYQKVV